MAPIRTPGINDQANGAIRLPHEEWGHTLLAPQTPAEEAEPEHLPIEAMAECAAITQQGIPIRLW